MDFTSVTSMATEGGFLPAGLEALFDHSPLDSLPDFVSYCKYMYSSGSMGNDLYAALGAVRRVLRAHAAEIERLKCAVREASPGTPSTVVTPQEEEELARIDEMAKAVEFLEHSRKRNAYTLSKSMENEGAIRALSEKLAACEGELAAKEAELRAAQEACAAFRRMQTAQSALQAFYDDIGVTALEANVKRLQSSSGKASGSRGNQFETLGLQYVHSEFMAELSQLHEVPLERLRYTANVTLKIPQVTGTAGELDGLVFEVDPQSQGVDGCGRSCCVVLRVLAVIEMKRNIDDIGPAFGSRLRTLRWLAGMESDAERVLRRNKHYPSGRYSEPLSVEYHHHYDKAAKHVYDFPPSCFEYFRSLEETGRGKDLLHFFVRPSPLTCVASSDSARIQFSLAASVDIDEDAGLDSPANEAALDALRLKIRASSRQQAESDSGEGGEAVVATAFDVAQECRLHLLVPPDDRNRQNVIL